MLKSKDVLALKGKFYKFENKFYLVEEISHYPGSKVYKVIFIDLTSFLRISGQLNINWFTNYYSNFFE